MVLGIPGYRIENIRGVLPVQALSDAYLESVPCFFRAQNKMGEPVVVVRIDEFSKAILRVGDFYPSDIFHDILAAMARAGDALHDINATEEKAAKEAKENLRRLEQEWHGTVAFKI